MTAGERGEANGLAQLRAAAHDLQTRLGSVHIAITAVCELDFEPKTQTMMLQTASEETMRAAAEVSGVVSLARCLLDVTEPTRCDLSATLTEAAEFCRLTGLDAAVHGDAPIFVLAPQARLRHALDALVRIVAGSGRAVTVQVEVVGDRAVATLFGTGGDGGSLPPITDFLVAALGAYHEPTDIGLAFSFGLATL